MGNVIFNTVIYTDGTNTFPKPSAFEEELFDAFFNEDNRFKDSGLRVGLENKVFFDEETITADGAWIICSGPNPVSEEKLRQIVQRERLSIWKPRSVMQWVEFFMD
jgi:hypothetical protein